MDPELGHCDDGPLCVCEKPIPSTQRSKLRNNSETYPNAIEPKSVISTPVTNHRKRRMNKEKKTNVKKQRRKSDSVPKEETSQSNEDVFNMSLPIPESSSSCDYVENEEEKTLTDSDGDLPVGLTPVTFSNTLQEKDLVWVKWKKPPYLPGIVKHLYKRKNRVSLFIFYPKDKPQKPYTMTIKKGSIISYFHPRRTEIMNSSKCLPSEELQYFNTCMQRLEEFLMKKALKEMSDEWSFFGDEDEETYANAIEPKSVISTPVTNHRKRRMNKEKKTNVKKQRRKSDSAPKDETSQTNEDVFNMSLPIPESTRKSAADEFVKSSCDYVDNEEEKYLSDSDGNLPVGLSPVTFKTYPNAIEPKSVISTPVTNHRKRRMNKEKKTNVKKQRRKSDSVPKEEPSQSNEDVFNMSLPIPESTSSCDYVENEEEKSLTDSDGDLPVGLTPVKFKTYPNAIEPKMSTPVTNHRKRRMNKSDSASKDEPCQSNEDVFNMSLPTPKSTSSCDYVENEEEKYLSDSDGDLPVGLTPVKFSNTLQEKDLVWVKWKNPPYLPGIVKHLYKRKKRVTLFIFYPKEEPQKPYSMTITKSCIFSYFDPRRTEIMNSSKCLPKEELQYFNTCVQRLEEFLMKKALKEMSDEWSFFGDEDEEIMAEFRKETEPVTGIKKRQGPLTENKMSDSDTESEKEPVREFKGLSKRGLLRKERLKEKTQILTEFLLSDDCKEYLFKIFKKEVKSELHQVIIGGTVKERRNIKHQGFGPIDDEEQIDSILMTYHSWLGEVNKSPYLHTNDYVFDCWVPEAIVYGLKTIRKYSTKRAWEMFYKGVKCSKEELKLFIEEFLGKPVEKKTS